VKNLSSNHTFINEASKNDINTENFAKKLLGQIVFIYFIQKKAGWAFRQGRTGERATKISCSTNLRRQ